MRNCFTYAVGKWRREGGYVVMRRSFAFEVFNCAALPLWHPKRLVWFIPHFLHRGYDGCITQLVPTAKEVRRHRACPLRFVAALWWLQGEVIEGDFEVEKFRAALSGDD